MTIADRTAIRQTAADRLGQASYSPKKLALIYAAAALGVNLVAALLDLALAQGISNTGGLSGMGMRSVLETVRVVLQYAGSIALPFWGFGFMFAALGMARGEASRPASLLEGFRRFGPVLRLQLMQGFLYVGVGSICFYAGTFLYALSPLAAPLRELLEPMLQDMQSVEQMEQALAQLPVEELVRIVWPLLLITGLVCAVVMIPLVYKLRLASWFVMDEPGTGALVAMVRSIRCMRRNGWKLFRLDLSFWWYYLLLGVSAVVVYGDLLLSALGISLPMSADAAWIVFYLLGLGVQLVVYWQTHSYVQTAYGVAYDLLRQQDPVLPAQKPAPENLPWEDYTADN